MHYCILELKEHPGRWVRTGVKSNANTPPIIGDIMVVLSPMAYGISWRGCTASMVQGIPWGNKQRFNDYAYLNESTLINIKFTYPHQIHIYNPNLYKP